MQIVDTNIVLRYILSDNEELSAQAEKIIDNNHIYIPIEVLCEVVYVLDKVYNASRGDVAVQLTDFIDDSNVSVPHREAVLLGLRNYGLGKLDFVDCVLVGYAKAEDAEIHTFDKALRKLIDSQD